METLSVFLCPALSESSVLFPVLGVAEIVTALPSRKLYGAPKWVHGFCVWRETEILVLDYQHFLNEQPVTRKKSHMVILNTLSNNEHLPFMGMIIDGVPQRVELSEHDLNNPTEAVIDGKTWHHFDLFDQKVWVAPQSEIEAEVAQLFKASPT